MHALIHEEHRKTCISRCLLPTRCAPRVVTFVTASWRLLRRTQVYIVFVCFLVFLLGLANFTGTFSLNLLSSFQESPYYTEHE